MRKKKEFDGVAELEKLHAMTSPDNDAGCTTCAGEIRLADLVDGHKCPSCGVCRVCRGKPYSRRHAFNWPPGIAVNGYCAGCGAWRSPDADEPMTAAQLRDNPEKKAAFDAQVEAGNKYMEELQNKWQRDQEEMAARRAARKDRK